MKIGYARQSTTNQKNGLENQISQLKQNRCEKIFSEEISSVANKRPELSKALEFCREGDTLIVTSLSRFARSISDLWKNLEIIQKKGADLQILDMQLDTSTPTGKLLLNLMGSVYQFEREILLERQMVGIAKAKSEGKYKGRKPLAKYVKDKIKTLRSDGTKPSEIATELGIGVASVYRYQN
jgi:DNA invertase Pin-like site-specific DNA recombinase